MATGHLRKRTSVDGAVSYQLIVEGDRDPVSGKRERRYKTIKGTKKAAEAALRKMIDDMENGNITSASAMKVEDWMNTWLENYLPNIEATTRAGYREKIKNYIIPELGNSYYDFETLQLHKQCFASLENKSVSFCLVVLPVLCSWKSAFLPPRQRSAFTNGCISKRNSVPKIFIQKTQKLLHADSTALTHLGDETYNIASISRRSQLLYISYQKINLLFHKNSSIISLYVWFSVGSLGLGMVRHLLRGN